jgi:protease I
MTIATDKTHSEPAHQDHHLAGLQVAILVMNGFEQIEMTRPRAALEELGVSTRLLSDRRGQVQGYKHKDKGDTFEVDMTFSHAKADEFDAVLLPGGEISSASIRHNADAQRIVKNIEQQGKPIAVICHAPWLLISSGLVEGRRMTSFPGLKDDLTKAGAEWEDAEVVVDGVWVSSRTPDDIGAFSEKFIEVLGRRTRESVAGTADDLPAGAGMGG